MKPAFSAPTEGPEAQSVLFTEYRRLGYDGLQLKAGQYRQHVDVPAAFAERWGRDPGLTSALIAGGRLNEPGIAGLRRLFAFGRAVRAERIVFCLGEPRAGLSAAELRGYAEVLSDLGDEARESGLRLSLHHHYEQPVMHRAEFDCFFEAVREGTVGLTVDTAHALKSGITDVAGLIRDFRGVIDNIHVKDFAGGEFRVLGEGTLDFGPVFDALREIGYDGWVCADEESGSDLVPAMAACRRFMEAHGVP